VKLSYGFAIVLEIILLGLRSVVPQALSWVGAGCSGRWATSAGRFAQKVGLTTSSEPRYESATNRQRGTASEVLGDHVSQYKRDIPYATLAQAFQPVPNSLMCFRVAFAPGLPYARAAAL
jgi:hypothetical protein